MQNTLAAYAVRLEYDRSISQQLHRQYNQLQNFFIGNKEIAKIVQPKSAYAPDIYASMHEELEKIVSYYQKPLLKRITLKANTPASSIGWEKYNALTLQRELTPQGEKAIQNYIKLTN